MAELNGEHDALRFFRSLTPDEKLENLWMGMRELGGGQAALTKLGEGMIQRQDRTNGAVTATKKELDVHLELHKMEEAEISFMKRWGGRGTGGIAVLISVATFLVIAGDRIWH